VENESRLLEWDPDDRLSYRPATWRLNLNQLSHTHHCYSPAETPPETLQVSEYEYLYPAHLSKNVTMCRSLNEQINLDKLRHVCCTEITAKCIQKCIQHVHMQSKSATYRANEMNWLHGTELTIAKWMKNFKLIYTEVTEISFDEQMYYWTGTYNQSSSDQANQTVTNMAQLFDSTE